MRCFYRTNITGATLFGSFIGTAARHCTTGRRQATQPAFRQSGSPQFFPLDKIRTPFLCWNQQRGTKPKYEARGKVKRYEFNNATTQSTYVVNYQFNDAGSTKQITYPDGAIYQYEFFPDGSPERLHQASHVIAQRSVYIDPADGLETTELLFENGTMSRRTKRDDSGRLLSLLSETVSPQTPIMERNLNYYTNGKIQQIIDVETDRTSNYGYDSLMRLSEWSDSEYQQFETYSFLDAGTPNPKLQSVVNNTTTLSFSYADPDFPWAVTQIVDDQAQSTKTLSYDEDGIVHVQSVNGYNTTHTYNAQGLVKKVSQLFSNRKWKYNHEGAAATIQATTGFWPPITTTTELIGNLYERYDNNYFTTDYRYHFFGGQRIARTIVANNDINYYHADERGSVRYVTDNQGTVTANFDYKPYGDEFTSSGSSTFRFNDRRDEGYDQLRFPLRMLNKTTYHWTALDPKVLTQPSVLLTNGANPFVYCMYDPINRADADGGASESVQKAIARIRALMPIPVIVAGPEARKAIAEASQASPWFKMAMDVLDDDSGNWPFTIAEGYTTSDQAQTKNGTIQCDGNKKYKGRPVPCSAQYIHEVAGHINYHLIHEGILRRNPASDTGGPEVDKGRKAHNQGQMEVRRSIIEGKILGPGEDANSNFLHGNKTINETKEFMRQDDYSPFIDYSEPMRSLMIEVFSW